LKALRGKLKPDRVVGAIQSREQEVISPLLLAKLKQEKSMLTKVIKRTKNEIKPTKKWDNAVIVMLEKYENRKKVRQFS